LKFLTKAGSPEPVMTRHLCAAGPAERSTAAGVAAARTVAIVAAPATTVTAIQRVVRRLLRIVCPFSPSGVVGQFATDCPKALPERLPRLRWQSQGRIFANCGRNQS